MDSQLWTWDWEVSDRRSWPSTWGRITFQDENFTERDAFMFAFEIIMFSTRAAMVTRLDLVDWPEEEP